MAIDKRTTYEIQCDGPCKRKVSLTRPPDGWYRLKITPAIQDPGKPAKYLVACLCPECKAMIRTVVETAGCNLILVEGRNN